MIAPVMLRRSRCRRLEEAGEALQVVVEEESGTVERTSLSVLQNSAVRALSHKFAHL